MRITGVVQGVGFRPFLFRIAVRHNLTGFARNETGSVIVEVEGNKSNLDSFRFDLEAELPPLAFIDQIETEWIPAVGDSEFIVETSRSVKDAASLLSPDAAVCVNCLRECDDPADRRFRHPFINCTGCGPRFSIITGVPYDRARTTMSEFELCPDCAKEYGDVADRRFHAEPVTCPNCGPHLEYRRVSSAQSFGEEALKNSIDALVKGEIVAVKGIGGFHLACSAFDEIAVAKLRFRKGRPAKPLAVMFCNVEEVRKYCILGEDEEAELVSVKRPILLLRKLSDTVSVKPLLANSIAPGLDELGVFLPYTPLHHLLFKDSSLTALVMTSGNRSEEPILIDNNEACEKLSSIADSYLMNNREIWNRCDDSVGYVGRNGLVLTRRSRGFAPLPVRLPDPVKPTLALGAMYCNTFTIASGKRAFISQHIGDVDNRETLDFLRESIAKFEQWLGITPEIIACDLHPDLLTTRLAEELALGVTLTRIQHHEAHFASILAANQCQEPAIGLVCDGTGFGRDGIIWGGEILFDDRVSVKRLGRLKPLPLPGGDRCIRFPSRTAIAWLHKVAPWIDVTQLSIGKTLGSEEIAVIKQMIDRNFNAINTSSVGRLFDAVSAILGVCLVNTYEGQAAIELESLASSFSGDLIDIPFDIADNNRLLELDTAPAIASIAEMCLNGIPSDRLAASFHRSLGKTLALMACDIAEQNEAKTIALCGGVFQNRLLSSIVEDVIKDRGMRPLMPGIIPVNDGGISLGQVVLANRNLFPLADALVLCQDMTDSVPGHG